MNGKIIMIGMVFGSVIGSYIPTFWGAGTFSFTSIFCGFIGGCLGIWASYRLVNN